jgi:D-alanyl-D-alanine carboxypeptidase
MRKFIPLYLIALLLEVPMTSVNAAPAVVETDAALAARIDAVVAPHYNSLDPGATLLVIKHGKAILRKSYGMADVARSVPLQPGMAMRIGSITKQFTSTAILMLAEEGKLSLSDPVSKYFPDFPADKKNIMIEHLLTHTSGLVNYTRGLKFIAMLGIDKSMGQVIDSFKDEPLEFVPGTGYAYSNSGYFLLGAIIEKVSGQTYAKFLNQRIFAPLGMMQTGYEGFEATPAFHATGHSTNFWGGFGTSRTLSMSQAHAAGALVSTVDDLAKWDGAINDGKLLKATSWSKALTPHRLPSGKSTMYGYGWQTAKVRGANEVGHGGDITGFAAYALRLPEHNLYVVLMTNTDSGMARPVMVAKKAAAVAIGNPYPEHRAVVLNSAALDVYAGQYKLNERVSRTVRRTNDHLEVERAGRPTEALYPMGTDRFFSKGSVTLYRFDRNTAGAVGQLVLDEDGIEHVHARVK